MIYANRIYIVVLYGKNIVSWFKKRIVIPDETANKEDGKNANTVKRYVNKENGNTNIAMRYDADDKRGKESSYSGETVCETEQCTGIFGRQILMGAHVPRVHSTFKAHCHAQ